MKFKEYLVENNITVSSLAKNAHLPYSTVSEIVNGKKRLGRCSADTVYNIAKTLGTTVESILGVAEGTRYPDKYTLSTKQSLFLAKRKWDENVYCGMKMEGRAVTFPQTRTILDGINVPSILLEDILAIRNMRDAWKYLFKSMDEKLDLNYICKLNEFIARDEALECGVLRTGSVGISGTNYKPPVPDRIKAENDIRNIIASYSTATERALDIFCHITYKQLFWDGNKRTAMTAANKILISSGKGILTIQDHDMEKFNKLLLEMYNTGKREDLKDFLYSNAIQGMERP